MERYDAVAPLGYPAVHHLTSPLRRAAAAAGDAGLINLWAGTGHAGAGATPSPTCCSASPVGSDHPDGLTPLPPSTGL